MLRPSKTAGKSDRERLSVQASSSFFSSFGLSALPMSSGNLRYQRRIVSGDDTGYLHQRASAELPAAHRESTALGVR